MPGYTTHLSNTTPPVMIFLFFASKTVYHQGCGECQPPCIPSLCTVDNPLVMAFLTWDEAYTTPRTYHRLQGMNPPGDGVSGPNDEGGGYTGVTKPDINPT